MSFQHQRPHHDGYRLVIVPLHGSAAPLKKNQATSIMTLYPTQSHYPDPDHTSPSHILLIPNTWLGSNKYKFCKSLIWLEQELNSPSPAHEARALLIRPPRPVFQAIQIMTSYIWQVIFRYLWKKPRWSCDHPFVTSWFVVVLCQSNSISIISWWCIDIWDEKEKAQAYSFTVSRDLYPLTPYRHGMIGTGLWWCCKF